MLRLSTGYYVKRAHPQCVDVIDIRKIASLEDDRLETDVLSRVEEWMQLIVMKYFEDIGCDSSISRAISSEVLHGCRYIAEIMASSLDGVHTARQRLAFTCAGGVTFTVPRRRCSNRRNTLVPE
jgi:hypothetical protein